MAPAVSRPRKTVQDYLALPDGVRAELIEGEIYVTPTPEVLHQRTHFRLGLRLGAWVEATPGRGEFLPAPMDVHLPSGEVVQPDFLYVTEEHRGILRRHVHGVPDLVIEIVSPSHPERDLVVKRDLYARNGVREYWIVHPADQAIEILRLEHGTYRPAGYFVSPATLTTPTLPGLSLALAEIFRP